MRTAGGRSVSEMQGEKHTSLAVCIWKKDGLPPPAFLLSYLWCGGDGVIADDICLGSDITCTVCVIQINNVCWGADNYHVTARGGAVSNGSDRRNEDRYQKRLDR